MTTGKTRYVKKINNLEDENVLLNEKIEDYITYIHDLVIRPIEQIPFTWKCKTEVDVFNVGIMSSEKLHIIQLPMKYFNELSIPNITSIKDINRIDFKNIEWIYTIDGLVNLIIDYPYTCDTKDRNKLIDNIIEFMSTLDDKEARMYLANYM